MQSTNFTSEISGSIFSAPNWKNRKMQYKKRTKSRFIFFKFTIRKFRTYILEGQGCHHNKITNQVFNFFY